jgi:hypothetical protein
MPALARLFDNASPNLFETPPSLQSSAMMPQQNAVLLSF